MNKSISQLFFVVTLTMFAAGTAFASTFDKFLDTARQISDQVQDFTDQDNSAPPGQNNQTVSGNNNSRTAGGSGALPQIVSATSFTPGDSVIFQSSFGTASPNDFLNEWNTSGSGEVVTVNPFPGRWLALSEKSSYKAKNMIRYPQKFSVEFDVLGIGGTVKDVHSTSFGFQNNNVVRGYIYPSNATGVSLKFRRNQVDIYSRGRRTGDVNFDFVNRLNSPFHVAILVDGQNMSVYLDGTKVASGALFQANAQKHFYISGPRKYYNQGKALIRNVRIAGFSNP